MIKRNYLMNVPDLNKLDGNLYCTIGYNSDDDPLIEIRPSSSIKDKRVVTELKDMMGRCGKLLSRPFTEKPKKGIGLWNREGVPGTPSENPPFCYEYIGWSEGDWFLIGTYYDCDYRSDKEVDYTYICSWIISKDLYNELKEI